MDNNQPPDLSQTPAPQQQGAELPSPGTDSANKGKQNSGIPGDKPPPPDGSPQGPDSQPPGQAEVPNVPNQQTPAGGLPTVSQVPKPPDKDELNDEHIEVLVEEEVEDIGKQKKEKDYSGEWGKQVYCKRHFNSFLPIYILLHVCGRFPFHCKKEANGCYLYRFVFFHPAAIFFFVMSVVTIFLLVSGISASAFIALNVTSIEINPSIEAAERYEERRLREDLLVKRYFVPIIYIYLNLAQICVSSALIFKKRRYIAHYLTFLSRCVYTLHIDVSKKALHFNIRVIMYLVASTAALALFGSFHIGTSSGGTSIVYGMLTLHPFLPDDWLDKDYLRGIITLVGAVCFLFTFFAAMLQAAFFIYLCKILQVAFAYWNGRVYASVLRGGELASTIEGRIKYKLLFKDHCILMDLVEGFDQVFAFQMETFFGCRVFSFFFELYFCIRTAKHGDNVATAAYPAKTDKAYFIRPRDWAPGLVIVCISAFVMAGAAHAAAALAEEAKAGMEVLRRRTLLKRKTDEELFFLLSMFTSYTSYKQMNYSGAGYFYIDKEFMIGIFAAAFSYFIILYQFQPVMDVSYSGHAEFGQRETREKFGKFLEEIEGLPSGHYETTPHPGDFWENFRA